MSAALKAAKVAGLVTLLVFGFAAVILGGVWVALHYFGFVGYLVFLVVALFTVAWFCAMADIRTRGEQ